MAEPEEKTKPLPATGGITRTKEWREWLDVTAKLIGAIAVAIITWVVHDYDSKLSLTTLQSQREQSESSLRAAMLHDLVDPILGRPAQGQEIDPERERLLVELLTLNFHNHFEFKPLLLQVDARLAASSREAGRESLESVARRVADRQINMLGAIVGAEKRRPKAGVVSVFEPVALFFKEATGSIAVPADCGTERDVGKTQQKPALFNQVVSEPVCTASADGIYNLIVSVLDADFEKKTVKLSIAVSRRGGPGVVRSVDFSITPFDFPLTDNNELDPDHRFALVLYHPDKKNKIVELRLVWFPKGYIPERERPIDYIAIRKLLGQ